MVEAEALSRHLPMLYRMAWMLTGNEADAEDLAHDTMVSALTSLGRFRAESKLSTWLSTILINRHRALRRSAAVRTAALPRLASRDVASPGAELDGAEEQAALARALDSLTADERELVTLSVYQGLESAEIGLALGRPAGTIRYQLHEAREKLRTLLEKR